MSHITVVINETFADTTAATVHECLVNAFPDLQAQQSSDQEEIYYLGIKLNNYMTTEDRVVEWYINCLLLFFIFTLLQPIEIMDP